MIFPLFVIFLDFLFILVSSAEVIVKWIENPSFQNPANWLSDQLPCSQDEILFPESYAALLSLPEKFEINGIILPIDGALLFQPDSIIYFPTGLSGSSNRNKDNNCFPTSSNGYGQKVRIKNVKPRKWFNPHNWKGKHDAENRAVPDIERVPCNNETVQIPLNGSLSIDLDDIGELRLGQLVLGNSNVSSQYAEFLFRSELGQAMFKFADRTKVKYFHEPICGCHHEDVLWQYEWNVCLEMIPECVVPHCLVPITPIGHCCALCGSVISLTLSHCDDGLIFKMKQLIADAIEKQELSSELDFHVSVISTVADGITLQAIVIDRDTYNQRSVDFVTRLNDAIKWNDVFLTNHSVRLIMSGIPYNPDLTLTTIFSIFVCLMGLAIFGFIVFARYAPDNQYLNYIPPWVYDPRRWRDFLLRSPFVFSRFENVIVTNPADGEPQHDIVVGYNAESTEIHERAFDNPMFVKSSNDERNKRKKISIALAKQEDEQELTEIDLDLSDERGDDDYKTTQE